MIWPNRELFLPSKAGPLKKRAQLAKKGERGGGYPKAKEEKERRAEITAVPRVAVRELNLAKGAYYDLTTIPWMEYI